MKWIDRTVHAEQMQMTSSKSNSNEIYSCLIRNNTDVEINIQVDFAGIEDHHHEIADLELAHGEEEGIDEKEFEHGPPDNKHHKTIEKIRIRKFDGSTLELQKPFQGKDSVIFEVNQNEIKVLPWSKK